MGNALCREIDVSTEERVEPKARIEMNIMRLLLAVPIAAFAMTTANAATMLYEQDFENPTGFGNTTDDVSQNSVNSHYGGQPAGFTFAQEFTAETLLITGTEAFGTGYSDPSGIGGNYALGMLSDRQDDKLGLAFNVGTNDFLNLTVDLSSIDLSDLGGPFIAPGGEAPEFEFTLYDNPSGVNGTSTGTILARQTVTATASAPDTFDWTRATVPLDAMGATNGNVILGIDLLSGGYAALDNFQIEASNTPVAPAVPEPTAIAIWSLGIVGLTFGRRRRV
tara:strand:- start:101504 stop:102340 length:837 start_codon:yes stop_codon:yes gene_type:complete